ncbi:hypothetical protein [Pseudacidovorax sp. RU35E]|nr:hypothetical protein [Pseudacidovorax sp. RU35E]SIR60555.1 hypothetical protein SAMN05880557_11498 [Pseudacidovorax sp. RU35E]
MQSWFGLIELLLVFGGVIGWAVWQWWDWRRWKARQPQRPDQEAD